jgi:hypothetical protein
MQALILTYNPDDHRNRAVGEPYLNWMLTEHRMFAHTVVGWGCITKKGVVRGLRALLLQQGPYDRGIFAEGIVLGEPVEGRGTNPSELDKDWMVVPVMFTRLIDPRRDIFLYDADQCQHMGINLSQQASGILVELNEEVAA